MNTTQMKLDAISHRPPLAGYRTLNQLRLVQTEYERRESQIRRPRLILVTVFLLACGGTVALHDYLKRNDHAAPPVRMASQIAAPATRAELQAPAVAPVTAPESAPIPEKPAMPVASPMSDARTDRAPPTLLKPKAVPSVLKQAAHTNPVSIESVPAAKIPELAILPSVPALAPLAPLPAEEKPPVPSTPIESVPAVPKA